MPALIPPTIPVWPRPRRCLTRAVCIARLRILAPPSLSRRLPRLRVGHRRGTQVTVPLSTHLPSLPGPSWPGSEWTERTMARQATCLGSSTQPCSGRAARVSGEFGLGKNPDVQHGYTHACRARTRVCSSSSGQSCLGKRMSVAVGAGHGLGSGAEPRTPPPASPAPLEASPEPRSRGGGGSLRQSPCPWRCWDAFPPRGADAPPARGQDLGPFPGELHGRGFP